MEINIGKIILDEEVCIGDLELNVVKETPELEDLIVIPSAEEQNFKSEKYGYNNVKVKAIETEELSITPGVEEQIKEGVFSKVTVTGSENLIPENIKKDVEIFGVTGTAETGNAKMVLYTGGISLKGYLKRIPLIDTSDISNFESMFSGCFNLESIPFINTEKGEKMSKMFSGCSEIKTIPLLNTENVTNMNLMFQDCINLKNIPNIKTNNVTNFIGMFRNCSALEYVHDININRATSLNNMFSSCTSLKSVSFVNNGATASMQSTFSACKNLETVFLGDTSNISIMESAFSSCDALINFPYIDTSNVTNMRMMFNHCDNLKSVPQLNAGMVNSVGYMFMQCYNIIEVGGLKDLGKAYTQKTKNYSDYTFDIVSSSISYDSIINIINNLYDLNLTYDVANGGTLYSQSLQLGSKNIRKITEEEIAIATSKGWNVS